MPTKKTITYQEIPDFNNIYSVRQKKLHCFLIVLNDGSLCVFSPLKNLPKDTYESIESIGPISLIVAPNHYHNAALIECSENFPNVKFCASKEAAVRLRKITGLDFMPLAYLEEKLPQHISIVSPPGLKTGEFWLRIKQDNQVGWIVVDAFSGASTSDEGSRVEMLKTFPSYGVKDSSLYKNWLINQIDGDSPATIMPCHGNIVRSNSLGIQMKYLLSTKL